MGMARAHGVLLGATAFVVEWGFPLVLRMFIETCVLKQSTGGAPWTLLTGSFQDWTHPNPGKTGPGQVHLGFPVVL